MWPYWLLFAIPAGAAAFERTTGAGQAGHTNRRRSALGLVLFGVFVALMIGWRHEVGGDWEQYLISYERRAGMTLSEVLALEDPGYKVIEWISNRFDWGVYGVNLMAATLFTFGLVRFTSQLPRPWLALVASIPYLVIVLGMGYSRQGIALGCLMAGLVALGRGRLREFVFWALLGSTFHKSAVLVIPMAALSASRGRLWTAVWVGLVTATAYTLFLESSVEVLVEGYLVAQYQSSGAQIRLYMIAVPAAFFLFLRRRFDMSPAERTFWSWFSVAAIAAFAAFFLSPSSTAVDRTALYLLPLQLVVMAYFPDVLGLKGSANQVWVLLGVLIYASVQFVWLKYANFSYTWIPYQFYPLVLLR